MKTFAHSTVRSSTRPRPAAEQQGKTEDPFFPSHRIQHTHCCSRINKEHETSDSTSVERFVIPTLQCCYVFGMLHAVGMFYKLVRSTGLNQKPSRVESRRFATRNFFQLLLYIFYHHLVSNSFIFVFLCSILG